MTAPQGPEERPARAASCDPGRRRLLLLFVGCYAWAAGCGGAGPWLVPVVGKVTVDGQPLATGSVSFRPDKAKGNTSSYEPAGEIDARGEYRLFTAVKADSPRQGAPHGWYKVAVISAEPGVYPPRRLFTNPRYGDVETSGLSVEVVEGAPPGAYDLKLSKK